MRVGMLPERGTMQTLDRQVKKLSTQARKFSTTITAYSNKTVSDVRSQTLFLTGDSDVDAIVYDKGTPAGQQMV